MKFFSDKGTPRMHPCFNDEFAGDYFEIENAYTQTEIAGGSISQKIIESREDLAIGGTDPF